MSAQWRVPVRYIVGMYDSPTPFEPKPESKDEAPKEPEPTPGKPVHPATLKVVYAVICLACMPVALAFFPPLVVVLWIAALVLAIVAAVQGFAGVRMLGDEVERTKSEASGVAGLFVALATLVWPYFAVVPGRPLRIRGRAVHAELQPGDAWAEGPAPDCVGLNDATRLALARSWQHDAQTEHASVPAFSRVSWLLIGLGAPPELVMRTHGAALEEITHARRCFALAGGYAGKLQGVMPIPEILTGHLGVTGDPLVALALESLRDGCLIEDFNADVAGRACERTSDPAARALVETIARDERCHAELAWDILEWCLVRGGAKIRRAVAEAAANLPEQGPGAYPSSDSAIVGAADAAKLIAHGRVPAEELPRIYAVRRTATCERVARLLGAVSETRTLPSAA